MSRKEKPVERAFSIVHEIDLVEAHASAASSANWNDLIQFLDTPRYTVAATAISYRNINHWSEIGLIDDERDGDKSKWRKLSFRQMVWVRIIGELRKFGLSLEALKETKKSLFTYQGKPSGLRMDLMLALCVPPHPQTVFLAVFASGDAEIASSRDLQLTDEVLGGQLSYIRININMLLCEAFDSDVFMPPEARHKA